VSYYSEKLKTLKIQKGTKTEIKIEPKLKQEQDNGK